MTKKVTCFITKKKCTEGACINANLLKDGLFEFIQKTYPGLSKKSFISIAAVNSLRKKYLTSIVAQENKEINALEKEVVNAITNNTILSENIEPDLEEKLTFGQKMADKIASFGGSWRFITLFAVFVILWMSINVFATVFKVFDPYPFILLNLILSSIAALQAPIIMMSQNRQEQKDRIRSEHDYKINLKAELEIKLLHEKIDHLIAHQNTRLLEIQEIQADYLEDILERVKKFDRNQKPKHLPIKNKNRSETV